MNIYLIILLIKLNCISLIEATNLNIYNSTNYEYLKTPDALASVADLLYTLKYYEQAIVYSEKALERDKTLALAIKTKSKSNECLKKNLWFRFFNCPFILPIVWF